MIKLILRAGRFSSAGVSVKISLCRLHFGLRLPLSAGPEPTW
jgi:hypothetical protein